MILTALYVPGDRPERIAKAIASEADVVVVDLEDAVAPHAKGEARRNAAAWLSTVEIRINPLSTPWGRDDLAALAGVRAIRLPKVESPADVRAVLDLVPGARLHVLIETALGVENAYAIATADPRVSAIGLGEADLRSDLGVTSEDGLLWARSRIILAARAAGLPAPMMSVYPHVRDPGGLAASCHRGRALGFLGRSAIHPGQLATIRAAFTPSEEEVAAAHELLDSLRSAEDGIVVLPDGRMADSAMVGQARRILDAAQSDDTP